MSDTHTHVCARCELEWAHTPFPAGSECRWPTPWYCPDCESDLLADPEAQ